MKKYLLLCSCLGLALFANRAGATLSYWDPQGSYGSYATYTAGSLAGTWETASWSRNSAGGAGAPADQGQAVPVAWKDGDAAVFSVGSGATNSGNASTTTFTITMNGNHTVAGFFDGALNPNSCQVTIFAIGIMTMQPGNLNGFDLLNSSDHSVATLTLSNVVAGGATAGVCAEGSSQVYLYGANTYSGGTFLGFSGASYTGIWNFNNNASFGTGPIYLLNTPGGALVDTNSTALTLTNPVIMYNTAAQSVNIVGNPAGISFSGPWTLSGGAGNSGGGTYVTNGAILSAYGPVSIGSGAAANNLVTISGIISGTNAFTKFGVGILALSATNTFKGVVTVNNGTLALTSTGSISNAATIFVATNGAGVGGTFDVSAYPTYNLSSSTRLEANGLGATTPATLNGLANGTISLGSQPIYLIYHPSSSGDTGDWPLSVSQSALALNNNTLVVSNATATPLGAGTYTLIRVGDGFTGTITGTPNANVVVNGAGLAAGCTATIEVGDPFISDASDVNMVVKAATTSTTTALATPASIVYGSGSTVPYVATVTPDPSASGGMVQFFVNGSPLGSAVPVVSGGTATLHNTLPGNLGVGGTYSITATYSGSPDDVYLPSTATAVSQAVTKAPLTVTAKNQTTTYGTAIALTGSTQFTTTPATLPNGETIGSVTLTVSGGGANTEGVGTYTITPSAATGGTFTAANYTITYVAASTGLTVNPKALTITAKAQTKTYGSILPTGSGSSQFTSSGLVLSQTIGSVTLSCAGGVANAPVSGSPYVETLSAATGGTFIAANYTITYATANMTVNKLAIILGGSRPFDGTSTASGSILTVANTVSGDTVSVTGSATLAGTGPGSESITSATGLTLVGTSANNYTLTGASGTVTITSSPFLITSESINGAGNQFTMTWNSTASTTYHVIGGSLNSPRSTWATVYGPVVASGSSTTATFSISSPNECFAVVSP